MLFKDVYKSGDAGFLTAAQFDDADQSEDAVFHQFVALFST